MFAQNKYQQARHSLLGYNDRVSIPIRILKPVAYGKRTTDTDPSNNDIRLDVWQNIKLYKITTYL